MGRVFFDTSVLVYLFDRAAPEKQARARELLDRHSRDGSLVLGTQVLQEFFVATTRRLSTPLGLSEALGIVRKLAVFPIVRVDPDLIVSAGERTTREMVPFWDALIVEAALAASATRLFSEDLQHGQTISSLIVENPFT
ncbi:MAG: PIN domain-containing protein [Trueperaceae bacterium]